MEDPQDQLDRQQESERKLFIRIPNEILEDERLTPADKLVYGRGFTFKRYFESNKATAKALGLCEDQVKKSKQKLEKLGFLVMYENTGRGKKYTVPEPYGRLGNFTNQTGRGRKNHREPMKFSSAGGENLPPEIKGRLKGEDHSLKDKSFKEAPAPSSNDEPLKEDEEPKRYGNAEINEFLDEWEEATGFAWHGVRQERFAAKNLIAKYGSEAVKALVARVKAARHSDDQFAPQIAKPSQLVGKYEKLTALTMWEERNAKAKARELEATGPDFRALYPAMERDPYEDIKDTPEAKAERHRIAQELRKKLGFTKEDD